MTSWQGRASANSSQEFYMSNTPLDEGPLSSGGADAAAAKPVHSVFAESPNPPSNVGAASTSIGNLQAAMAGEVHALRNALGPLMYLLEIANNVAQLPAEIRELLTPCSGLLENATDCASRLSSLVRRLSELPAGIPRPVERGRETTTKGVALATPLPRLRLLCVEDDHFVREMLVKLLRTLGQSATAVGTISEAMQSFAEVHFDVVITDLRLQGEHGEDLTRRLRRQRAIPVIWITGYDDGRDLSELDAEAAPTFLLQKPISLEGLSHALGIAVAELVAQRSRAAQ